MSGGLLRTNPINTDNVNTTKAADRLNRFHEVQQVTFSFLFFFALLTGCRSFRQNHPGTDRNPTVISIGSVRNLPIGSSVTVQGTVIVASGSFASSSPYGYAIQDNTSGIYIIDSIPSKFRLGELIKVTGTSQKTNGMLAINKRSVTRKGKSPHIAPLLIRTGNVNNGTEGLLVHTGGILDSLKGDLPYGYKLFINDGSGTLTVFVNTSTGLLDGISPWKVLDSLSVTGFLAQYDGTFEIEPRVLGDIRVLSRD